MILGVINSISFRKPQKVQVLHTVLSVEVILVYMEEKMISIDTITLSPVESLTAEY